jgi:DNA-binding response OmpR family regulator
MGKANILVAEDDAHIREGLLDALTSEGYAVVTAKDGAEALRHADNVDLILLDIMMPEQSGYDVCRALRRSGNQVPVIMLTAKSEEIDKVVGLQLGADDYVTKPFGVHELLARVAAVLRRYTPSGSPRDEDASEKPFTFGEADIEPRQFTGTCGGRSFILTPRELKLLRVFRDHAGEVLSRDFLLNHVWGVDYFGTTRTLDQHIAQLRKKIEPDREKPSTIVTMHGVGYRYKPGMKKKSEKKSSL